MSSACVCHTDEWCFYCEMFVPLEKQLEKAKTALRWYANGNNYNLETWEIHVDVFKQVYPVLWDQGERARKALEELPHDRL